MNIDELTLREIKDLRCIFNGQESKGFDNGMIGKYVIVRCYSAGVHAGYLEAHQGRECLLKDSRRLWYWKPKKGKFLSAVANNGLSDESKLGETLPLLHLTDDCEIILCTTKAEKNISSMKSDE